MKKQAAMAFMLLSLMGTLAVTSVTAQSSSHFMRIKIPFEFAIRDKTFPPGEYTVRRRDSHRPETLSISSVDGGSVAYVLTNNVQGKALRSESKLVFNQYGDQYFLSQVWTDGNSAGRELPKSRRERAVDRELSKNTAQRKTVLLIAHRR